MRLPSLVTRSLPLFGFLPALAFACVAAASTGCGRTDLADELGLYPDASILEPDAQQPHREGGRDVTPPPDDAPSFDVFQPDVFQFDAFQPDVFQFDAFQPDVFQFEGGPDVFQFDVFEPDVTPPDDVHIIDVKPPPNDTGSCGDGKCNNGETCKSCPGDCGFCPSCGDGTCNNGETCSSCAIDCGACETCGNGFCDNGETCTTCPEDCGVCAFCGDGKCGSNENCNNCPADCGMCMGCGDGHCAATETCISCPVDCGSCAFCGNGVCDDGETCNSCAADCGACPIAATCEQILTCSFGCFQGGIGGFELSCLTECDANACTQAQEFANNATNCIINALITGKCGFGGGGGGGLLMCAESACAAPIAACLGSAPCPGSG